MGRWPLLAVVPPAPPLAARPRLCCREVCCNASRAARSNDGTDARRESRDGGRLRSAEDARELGALPRADPGALPRADDAREEARLPPLDERPACRRSTEAAREAAVELATDDAREDGREPPAAPAPPTGGRLRSAEDARDVARLPTFDPGSDGGRDGGRLSAFDPGREGGRRPSRVKPAPASGRPGRPAAARRCITFSSASSWRLCRRARSSSRFARLSSELSRITCARPTRGWERNHHPPTPGASTQWGGRDTGGCTRAAGGGGGGRQLVRGGGAGPEGARRPSRRAAPRPRARPARLPLRLGERAVQLGTLLLALPLELVQLGAQPLDHALVAPVRQQLVAEGRHLPCLLLQLSRQAVALLAQP